MKRFLFAVALVGATLWGGPAAAQTPQATLEVSPSSVTAGNPVSVSGTCANGPQAHLVVSSGDDGAGYSGGLAMVVQPDRSFAGTFPIPAEAATEPWFFSVQCVGGDAVYGSSGRLAVAVTGTRPVAGTVSVARGATARAATFSGTGCLADGRPLSRLTLQIGTLPDDGKGYLAHVNATVGANGSWTVTTPLRDYVGDGQVVADCTSTGNPSISRRAIAAFSVGPAGAIVTKAKIARTGGVRPAWLPYTAIALVLSGAAMRRVRPRARPSGS